VLRQLPEFHDPNLLSADIPFADAGIYRLQENLALVQSLDFFTPVVDDPLSYGKIAAANALSDIYAIGARPVTALNIVGFPPCLDKSIITEILTGGALKIAEAGAVLAGGHTVDDDEPKYGLSVTGVVDPAAMLTTAGAQPGDVLVLTKPLGTGILSTALKGEVLAEQEMTDAIEGMQTLNRAAGEVMLEVGAHACTDVTGFGLLGHMSELAEASEVHLELDGGRLPTYAKVDEMAGMGLIPEGSYNNRTHYLSRVENGVTLSANVLDILADPQTSGGLLIVLEKDKVPDLMRKLRERNVEGWIVGRVTAGTPGMIRVR